MQTRIWCDRVSYIADNSDVSSLDHLITSVEHDRPGCSKFIYIDKPDSESQIALSIDKISAIEPVL